VTIDGCISPYMLIYCILVVCLCVSGVWTCFGDGCTYFLDAWICSGTSGVVRRYLDLFFWMPGLVFLGSGPVYTPAMR